MSEFSEFMTCQQEVNFLKNFLKVNRFLLCKISPSQAQFVHWMMFESISWCLKVFHEHRFVDGT